MTAVYTQADLARGTSGTRTGRAAITAICSELASGRDRDMSWRALKALRLRRRPTGRYGLQRAVRLRDRLRAAVASWRPASGRSVSSRPAGTGDIIIAPTLARFIGLEYRAGLRLARC